MNQDGSMLLVSNLQARLRLKTESNTRILPATVGRRTQMLLLKTQVDDTSTSESDSGKALGTGSAGIYQGERRRGCI